MSITEGALLLAALVIVFGGGYGLFLKYQIDHDRGDEDTDLKAPPAK
ncbi:MAG: hypothetical protein HY859_18775 [Caulobacterales bacterium]|nr:hypothetical protein [Caulobacterales bacterium]